MPALLCLNRRWQIATDFLPLIAVLGLIGHAIWFIVVGALFIESRPPACNSDTSARLLRSVLDGTLLIMGLSTLLELPIIVIGLRGIIPPPPPL